MGESNNKKRRGTHSNSAPDRRNIDIPREENSSNDGHNDDVVGKCPEKIEFDEQISSFNESNHG